VNSQRASSCGQVATFICLHEDSATDTQKKQVNTRANGKPEQFTVFEVLGKHRPCLIIGGLHSGYYKVWRLTSDRNCAKLRSLRRSDNRPIPSFLRDLKRHPNEVRWIHEKLKIGIVGEIDREELNEIYRQLQIQSGYLPPADRAAGRGGPDDAPAG
jgi:hypothetical protein